MRIAKQMISGLLGGVVIAGWISAAPGCVGAHDSTDDHSSPALSAPEAASPAGGTYVVMTRPPNVPSTYVATPNGWFDPSCVHALADEDQVLADGRIARRDGTNVREGQRCLSPRYDAQGREIDDSSSSSSAGGDRAKTPSTSGWVEYADSIALGAVSYLHAQWTVPPAPAVTDATIYFFPGLENKETINTPIIQPVLGWNQYGGPAGQWSLQSWNCCTQGTFYSAAIPAAVGASVSGDMTGTSCGSNGVCASWAIASHNLSTGANTTLTTTPNIVMDYVFAGVLETYGVNSCDELPPSGVTFSGFSVSLANGTHVATPTWSDHVLGTPSPSCGYGMTSTATTATAAVAGTQCTPGDDRACCPYPQGCVCDGDQTCNANGKWQVGCEGAGPKGGVCP